jgi:RimJ/RimL family protein N-acetyltransferase
MTDFSSITVPCRDGAATVRALSGADRAALHALAQTLPSHDLLFLRRDVTQEAEITRWLDDNAAGRLHTLVAEREGRLLGVAVIIPGEAHWSPHVGELLVLVAPSARSIGLGRQMVQQAFRLAVGLGMDKIVAQMTTDQVGAIQVFEGLGFKAEALLRDHVKDRDGSKHDLVMLCHDVDRFASQQAAYGMTDDAAAG